MLVFHSYYGVVSSSRPASWRYGVPYTPPCGRLQQILGAEAGKYRSLNCFTASLMLYLSTWSVRLPIIGLLLRNTYRKHDNFSHFALCNV